MMGAFFTATSMIGFIASSGIVVRNSIIQGLAIALISGKIASTLLSRIAVPIFYYLAFKNDKQITGGSNEN
jgi:multidrug efflux pump subunit AcrB